MKTAIISEEKKKRLEKYANLKKEFLALMSAGGQKTAVIKYMAESGKVSSATIYKAIK